MTTLVITEKPSVARDIAEILPEKFTAHDGYLEGNKCILTWAVGHLVELASPDIYDPKLRHWNMETLPIFPDCFRLVPKPSTQKQLQVIKKLITDDRVDRIINACDAGREGELIFRYIVQYIRCKKPQERLWLSETTPAAVKAAFANLRSSSGLDGLAQAAVARNQADWIVGINASRAYTLQCGGGDVLTVGRVQTPTLALVVNRDREIDAFSPVPYWQLQASFNTGSDIYNSIWFDGDADRFYDRHDVNVLADSLQIGQAAAVSDLEEKEVKEPSPHLYNLNDLQKDANRLYGLTADETLQTAQILYERRLLTYPRTDSRHLTTALADTLPERLQVLKATELDRFLDILLDEQLGKRYVDNTKVTDHTAIIITATQPDLQSLNVNERNLYLLVARRLLAAFYPAARYKKTKVVTSLQSQNFIAKGKVTLDPGWKVVYGEIDLEDKTENEAVTLPLLKPGQKVFLHLLDVLDKKTSPPKRYIEADLLSVMENIGRLIDDPARADVLKGKGIGTPATRAAIIEKLISTGYITRNKKNLISTDKGRHLIDIVSPRFKDPEMTGEWEQKLLDIEQGKYHNKLFLDEIKKYTASVINDLKAREPVKAPERQPKNLGACPLCGQPVVESKKGYGCSDWKNGCNFVIWKTIAGKKISQSTVHKLLANGKTELIKGFKSRNGNSFDAYLTLEDGKVTFAFPSRRA